MGNIPHCQINPKLKLVEIEKIDISNTEIYDRFNSDLVQVQCKVVGLN